MFLALFSELISLLICNTQLIPINGANQEEKSSIELLYSINGFIVCDTIRSTHMTKSKMLICKL